MPASASLSALALGEGDVEGEWRHSQETRFHCRETRTLPAAPHTHSLLGMNAREDGFYPLSRVWRVGRTKMENRKAGSGCGGCRLPRLSRRWR